ncbi:hypothetical protein [Kitasatospora sp. NPDC008115]|uniref:hypothetical protein n=1 Tax=Kitasatospora sp. NPDC008115 TaxID=3364022 RepID=UPI0036EEDDE2
MTSLPPPDGEPTGLARRLRSLVNRSRRDRSAPDDAAPGVRDLAVEAARLLGGCGPAGPVSGGTEAGLSDVARRYLT